MASRQGTTPRQALQRVARERCIPLNATVEITLACNLRCAHCYNFDRAAAPAPARVTAAQTRRQLLDVIEQLAGAGALYLSLTGGEALMHPHLDELVRHAREHRFVVGIKSNGTLLTEQRARRLRAAGASSVDVSLYGATARTHDAFTVQPGSFARTISGVRAARAAGLTVRANASLVRSNAHEVEQLLQLADDLGIALGLDPQITARYDGTRSSLDERLDRDQLRALYRGPLRKTLPLPVHDPGRVMQCNCARTVVAVASNGDVYPCIGAPLVAGNVRRDAFASIWAESPVFRRIRSLSAADFSACEPCPDRPYCRRSSGVVHANTGDYTGPEEFTCREAQVLHEIDRETGEAAAPPGAARLSRSTHDDPPV